MREPVYGRRFTSPMLASPIARRTRHLIVTPGSSAEPAVVQTGHHQRGEEGMLYFLIALIGLWLLFPRTAAGNPVAVLAGAGVLLLLLGGSCAG